MPDLMDLGQIFVRVADLVARILGRPRLRMFAHTATTAVTGQSHLYVRAENLATGSGQQLTIESVRIIVGRGASRQVMSLFEGERVVKPGEGPHVVDIALNNVHPQLFNERGWQRHIVARVTTRRRRVRARRTWRRDLQGGAIT